MTPKILVIRLGSIGDVVLITPVLRTLRKNLPQARISVLVKGEYAQILSGNPHVDEVISLKANGEHRGFWGLMRLIKGLKRERFDLVVDLHANLRSWLISTLMGAQRVIRYRKRWWQRRALVYLKWLPVGSRHTVDLYLDALRPLGIEVADRLPEIYLSRDDIHFAQNFLREVGVREDDLLIGLSLGASWSPKRWTVEGFSSLGDLLMGGHGAEAILFGDGADYEFVTEVTSRMVHSPILPPKGLSLGQLTALIDRCQVLVTNDSGPMHLAVARGVPVVAIFGPTHPKLGFSPLGPRDVVLTKDLGCSPCSLHGQRKCHRKSRECMELITPNEVLSAVERILGKSDAYHGPQSTASSEEAKQ